MEDYLKERKCIVVKRDNRGRCVEANEDIQKGSLISQAIVDNYILHPMYWTTKCYYCLKQLSKRNPNDVVTYDVGYNGRKEKMHVSFCNKKCVKKDYHFQYEKPHLKKLVATFLKDMSCISDLLLLSRCLRTSTEKYLDYSKQLPTKNEDCYYQNTFQDLQNMVYGKDDSRNEHVKIVKTLIELFKEEQETPEDKLLNILKRFGCNNFSITNKLMVSVAAACVPLGALLNHSCDPNCVVTYRIMENNNNRIVQQIRTVKDVKCGEELCHPYLDTACTKANRVEKL